MARPRANRASKTATSAPRGRKGSSRKQAQSDEDEVKQRYIDEEADQQQRGEQEEEEDEYEERQQQQQRMEEDEELDEDMDDEVDELDARESKRIFDELYKVSHSTERGCSLLPASPTAHALRSACSVGLES